MLAKNQEIDERSVGDFLKDPIQRVTGMFDENMSERQQQRIAETIQKNPARASGSRSVEALEDDRQAHTDYHPRNLSLLATPVVLNAFVHEQPRRQALLFRSAQRRFPPLAYAAGDRRRLPCDDIHFL